MKVMSLVSKDLVKFTIESLPDGGVRIVISYPGPGQCLVDLDAVQVAALAEWLMKRIGDG